MSRRNEAGDEYQNLKEILFQGKHVVITGGASGIGRALAEALHRLGTDVDVIDITTGQLPDEIHVTQTDVTDKNKLESAAGKKRVDLLIIAAGVTSETNTPSPEEQALMKAVNENGVENTLAVFGQYLTASAQLVYIGTHNPPKAFYAETKRRGAQLVKDFAATHSGVKITLVLLGPVRTKLFNKGKTVERIEQIKQTVGLYEPEEFADELIDRLTRPVEGESNLDEVIMYKNETKR